MELIRAVDSGKTRSVQLLLSQGYDPNYRDDQDGVSPMHVAAGTERPQSADILRLLLQQGGDPNLRSNDGLTPLHIAVMHSYVTKVSILLNHGSDPYLREFEESHNAFALAHKYNTADSVTRVLETHMSSVYISMPMERVGLGMTCGEMTKVVRTTSASTQSSAHTDMCSSKRAEVFTSGGSLQNEIGTTGLEEDGGDMPPDLCDNGKECYSDGASCARSGGSDCYSDAVAPGQNRTSGDGERGGVFGWVPLSFPGDPIELEEPYSHTRVQSYNRYINTDIPLMGSLPACEGHRWTNDKLDEGHRWTNDKLDGPFCGQAGHSYVQLGWTDHSEYQAHHSANQLQHCMDPCDPASQCGPLLNQTPYYVRACDQNIGQSAAACCCYLGLGVQPGLKCDGNAATLPSVGFPCGEVISTCLPQDYTQLTNRATMLSPIDEGRYDLAPPLSSLPQPAPRLRKPPTICKTPTQHQRETHTTLTPKSILTPPHRDLTDLVLTHTGETPCGETVPSHLSAQEIVPPNRQSLIDSHNTPACLGSGKSPSAASSLINGKFPAHMESPELGESSLYNPVQEEVVRGPPKPPRQRRLYQKHQTSVFQKTPQQKEHVSSSPKEEENGCPPLGDLKSKKGSSAGFYNPEVCAFLNQFSYNGSKPFVFDVTSPDNPLVYAKTEDVIHPNVQEVVTSSEGKLYGSRSSGFGSKETDVDVENKTSAHNGVIGRSRSEKLANHAPPPVDVDELDGHSNRKQGENDQAVEDGFSGDSGDEGHLTQMIDVGTLLAKRQTSRSRTPRSSRKLSNQNSPFSADVTLSEPKQRRRWRPSFSVSPGKMLKARESKSNRPSNVRRSLSLSPSRSRLSAVAGSSCDEGVSAANGWVYSENGRNTALNYNKEETSSPTDYSGMSALSPKKRSPGKKLYSTVKALLGFKKSAKSSKSSCSRSFDVTAGSSTADSRWKDSVAANTLSLKTVRQRSCPSLPLSQPSAPLPSSAHTPTTPKSVTFQEDRIGRVKQARTAPRLRQPLPHKMSPLTARASLLSKNCSPGAFPHVVSRTTPELSRHRAYGKVVERNRADIATHSVSQRQADRRVNAFFPPVTKDGLNVQSNQPIGSSRNYSVQSFDLNIGQSPASYCEDGGGLDEVDAVLGNIGLHVDHEYKKTQSSAAGENEASLGGCTCSLVEDGDEAKRDWCMDTECVGECNRPFVARKDSTASTSTAAGFPVGVSAESFRTFTPRLAQPSTPAAQITAFCHDTSNASSSSYHSCSPNDADIGGYLGNGEPDNVPSAAPSLPVEEDNLLQKFARMTFTADDPSCINHNESEASWPPPPPSACLNMKDTDDVINMERGVSPRMAGGCSIKSSEELRAGFNVLERRGSAVSRRLAYAAQVTTVSSEDNVSMPSPLSSCTLPSTLPSGCSTAEALNDLRLERSLTQRDLAELSLAQAQRRQTASEKQFSSSVTLVKDHSKSGVVRDEVVASSARTPKPPRPPPPMKRKISKEFLTKDKESAGHIVILKSSPFQKRSTLTPLSWTETACSKGQGHLEGHGDESLPLLPPPEEFSSSAGSVTRGSDRQDSSITTTTAAVMSTLSHHSRSSGFGSYTISQLLTNEEEKKEEEVKCGGNLCPLMCRAEADSNEIDGPLPVDCDVTAGAVSSAPKILSVSVSPSKSVDSGCSDHSEYLITDSETNVTLIEHVVPGNVSLLSTFSGAVSSSFVGKPSSNKGRRLSGLRDWKKYKRLSLSKLESGEESIPCDLIQLTDLEIRKRLLELGDLPGPVTETTRLLYLKRLKKLRDDPDFQPQKQRKGTSSMFTKELRSILQGRADEVALSKLELKMVQEFDQTVLPSADDHSKRKQGTPTNKLGTPTNKLGTPTNKLGTPTNKLATPSSKTLGSMNVNNSNVYRDSSPIGTDVTFRATASPFGSPGYHDPLSAGRRKKWREGTVKASFTYLLLDPRILKNLPLRAEELGDEAFFTFLSAIFYVGKGKRARPYQHFVEAVKARERGLSLSDKLRHITDIWEESLGVISLHCFQNVIPVEAYTREACMVDAIGLSNLTNQKKCDYYGVISTVPQSKKKLLGGYLLRKAFQILLLEGERQIRPCDVRK